jgi:hypothetical protein
MYFFPSILSVLASDIIILIFNIHTIYPSIYVDRSILITACVLEKVLEVIAFGSKYAAASRWMMDAAGAPQLIDGQGNDLRSRRCYFVATRPLISKLQPLQSAFILGTMCSIPRKYGCMYWFLFEKSRRLFTYLG